MKETFEKGQYMRSDFRGEVWINIHPDLLDTIVRINEDPVDGGYGDEKYARRATELMQQNFREPIYTTFAVNGTAANVMAMKAMLDRWSAIVCATQTHINVYEAGALEFNLGNKILSVAGENGKLTPARIEKLFAQTKNYKYNPKVVVLTQPTEYGTVYTIEELKALCDFAHGKGMYVYVDGARLANALVALDTDIGHMIGETGVDAFSFGGTKAGALFGEMIVFRRAEFNNNLKYSQKQSLQHLAKSKFLSAPIARILETELWKTNARIANAAANRLADKLAEKGIRFAYPVQTNMVFAVIEPERFAKITEEYALHYWEDEADRVVRLATTFQTTDEQIDRFVGMI